MHVVTKLFLSALFCTLLHVGTHAQTVDTTVARQLMAAKDSVAKPTIKNPAFRETDSAKLRDPNARIPRVAAIRSAILPGWGQIYNKKGWYLKVPVIYAALGITGGLFVDNLTWYNRTKYAYRVAINIRDGKDTLGSAAYNKVYESLRRVFFEGSQGLQPEYIRTRRDYFRKYVDYAAIYFIVAWGLNVVEAAVGAHLSSFDVSPDLSFRIQPGFSEMAQTTGISLVLKVK